MKLAKVYTWSGSSIPLDARGRPALADVYPLGWYRPDDDIEAVAQMLMQRPPEGRALFLRHAHMHTPHVLKAPWGERFTNGLEIDITFRYWVNIASRFREAGLEDIAMLVLEEEHQAGITYWPQSPVTGQDRLLRMREMQPLLQEDHPMKDADIKDFKGSHNFTLARQWSQHSHNTVLHWIRWGIQEAFSTVYGNHVEASNYGTQWTPMPDTQGRSTPTGTLSIASERLYLDVPDSRVMERSWDLVTGLMGAAHAPRCPWLSPGFNDKGHKSTCDDSKGYISTCDSEQEFVHSVAAMCDAMFHWCDPKEMPLALQQEGVRMMHEAMSNTERLKLEYQVDEDSEESGGEQ